MFEEIKREKNFGDIELAAGSLILRDPDLSEKLAKDAFSVDLMKIEPVE